ncbi:hypothetical protein FRC18_000490, partial [Serendipita sp. 400]
ASKLSLRAWYKKKKYARWDDSAKLPDEDRRYRQSVVTQHRTAEKARSWLSDYPLVVGQHKERVEKLWSSLKQASIANIDLATSLSCHLSTYHDQLEEFSPRAAITPVEETCKEDAESQIARPAAYHNYCIGGVKSPILFGADLFLPENRLEVLISELYRGYSLKLCPWGDLFDIEQTSGGIVEYMKLSSDSRKTNVRVVFEFELCHYNPLLPLKREIPSQLLDIPPSRNELASLLDFKLEEDDTLSSDRRRRLAHEISRYTPFFECLAVGQPHSVNTISIRLLIRRLTIPIELYPCFLAKMGFPGWLSASKWNRAEVGRESHRCEGAKNRRKVLPVSLEGLRVVG